MLSDWTLGGRGGIWFPVGRQKDSMTVSSVLADCYQPASTLLTDHLQPVSRLLAAC